MAVRSTKPALAAPLDGDATGDFPWRDPGGAGERLAVQDFPTFLLERVASLARRKLTKRYLDRAGLSLPEWRLLNIVARFSPTGFAEIVRRSTMDKAQISLTLRTLAARQWIAVAKARGTKSGRARIVTLTPLGRAVIRKVLPDARAAQMRVIDQLDADERRQLHRLLRKMAQILDRLDAE